jgi:hypothetical protein
VIFGFDHYAIMLVIVQMHMGESLRVFMERITLVNVAKRCLQKREQDARQYRQMECGLHCSQFYPI